MYKEYDRERKSSGVTDQAEKVHPGREGHVPMYYGRDLPLPDLAEEEARSTYQQDGANGTEKGNPTEDKRRTNRWDRKRKFVPMPPEIQAEREEVRERDRAYFRKHPDEECYVRECEESDFWPDPHDSALYGLVIVWNRGEGEVSISPWDLQGRWELRNLGW